MVYSGTELQPRFKFMFKSRNKSKFYKKIKAFFWPSLGWRRSTKYLLHRIARLPGTPYSTAAGFACGAAISFTPFVGLHFLLAGLIAWILRANIMAAVIGTVVGNPWTFPFIWTFIFNLGVWLGVDGTGANANALDFQIIFSKSLDAIISYDLSYLLETAWPVFWPMLIGSIPSFIVIWVSFYFLLRPLIKRYQEKRWRSLMDSKEVPKELENN